ncbi:MAG: response regulator transcription factor [Sphingomonadales bacterium]|nr:MAG: response regulator transcription factor [Sphingomonadales bacterium]
MWRSVPVREYWAWGASLRLILVDDHPLFVEGFQAMVSRLRPDWILETAASCDEALGALEAGLPDAMVTDVFLPDRNGFDLLDLVSERWPGLPVILVSGRDHAAMAMRAQRSAAKAFIAKSVMGNGFVEAIEAVLAGRPIPSAGPLLAVPQLTPRQAQVLALLAEGHGNKEIRHRLGIAERTVRAHLTELFGLLGVHGRMPAVIKARELGLIE